MGYDYTYILVVQKHFELIKVVPLVCFFRVHIMEIIACSRSKRMEIKIRRQQQSRWYFLTIDYRIAFV